VNLFIYSIKFSFNNANYVKLVGERILILFPSFAFVYWC